MKRPRVIVLICVSIVAFLSGCSVPRRDSITKQTYLLKVEHPEVSIEQPVGACFNIRVTRVAPAFSGSQLVYRTGPVSFEQDYYHSYLSAPDEQLDEIVNRWFRDGKQFVCRVDAETRQQTINMEPHLDELYADFQDPAAPASVVQMHFYLSRYDPGCGCPIEILKKSYSARTPLPSPKPTSDEVVSGLSLSIAQILLEVEEDIAARLASGM